MGTKLSQIALSPHPPDLTTSLVGVDFTGPTDQLFTFSQLSQSLPAPAPGNMDFYVSTAGSDSGTGDIGHPFATVQHAALVAASFNYQGLYSVTIHVAAGSGGSYTSSTAIILPPAINAVTATVVGAGSTSTVLENNIAVGAGPGAVFHAKGTSSEWFVQDFGLSCDSGYLQADHGGFLHTAGTINFNNSSNPGFGSCFGCGNSGSIECFFTTLNINLSLGFTDWFQDTGPQFRCDFYQDTINIIDITSISGLFENWVDTQGNAGGGEFSISQLTFTGIAGLGIGEYLLISSSGGDIFIGTDNGLLSDFPGTPGNPNEVDNSNYLFSLGFPNSGTFLQPHNGVPTPPAGTFSIYKDANGADGAGCGVVIQDGAVKLKIASGGPSKTSAPVTGSTVTSSYALRSNIVNPAGTLAALTVNLPTGVMNDDITRISFTQVITALTIATTDGSTIVGAPTTAAAGSAFQFIYSSTGPTWYIN